MSLGAIKWILFTRVPRTISLVNTDNIHFSQNVIFFRNSKGRTSFFGVLLTSYELHT